MSYSPVRIPRDNSSLNKTLPIGYYATSGFMPREFQCPPSFPPGLWSRAKGKVIRSRVTIRFAIIVG